MNTAQRNEIPTSSKTGLTQMYTTHIHEDGNHSRFHLFVYDTLLPKADCNHNTGAKQTLTAESHIICMIWHFLFYFISHL